MASTIHVFNVQEEILLSISILLLLAGYVFEGTSTRSSEVAATSYKAAQRII
jgi:hypothetical protein